MNVEWDGEVYGATPTVEGGVECAGDVFGRAERVSKQPRAFCHRLSHADLVYLLGSAKAQAVLGRAPGNAHDGRFHVVGESKARYGVGVAGSREHGHARFARDAAVGVCHVDGGLLVPHVDEGEALIGHVVHEWEGVVARDGEDGLGARTR